MNNQRDTQRTSVNLYDKSSVPDKKAFFDLPVSGVINKRTEKLVTALYLISDYMEDGDPIRSKLRLLGVELLSDSYKICVLTGMEKHEVLVMSLNLINEIKSIISSAYNIGLISEMNTSIIKAEFNALSINLEQEIMEGDQFSFKLDRRMFELDLSPTPSEKVSDKNVHLGRPVKDRENHNFISSPLNSFDVVKKTSHLVPSPEEKQDRQVKILMLVKDKKEASIKDISLAFTDCSEKTIQRELNTLVSKGQIKKTGSKRWSKYSIVSEGEGK